MYHKLVLILLLSSSFLSANLNEINVEHVQKHKEYYLKQARNLKYFKVTACVSATAIISAIIIKMLYSTKQPIVKSIIDPKLKETLFAELVQKELEKKNRTSIEAFTAFFKRNIISGLSLTATSLVLGFGDEVKGSLFIRIKQFLKYKIDPVIFNEAQVFDNTYSLHLYLTDFVEQANTEIDKAHHREQIVLGYGLLLETVERFMAALCLQAQASQEKWLLNSENKLFKAMSSLKFKVEQILDNENPNIKEVEVALNHLVHCLGMVAKNCEAQIV